jgi:hypothetical protein
MSAFLHFKSAVMSAAIFEKAEWRRGPAARGGRARRVTARPEVMLLPLSSTTTFTMATVTRAVMAAKSTMMNRAIRCVTIRIATIVAMMGLHWFWRIWVVDLVIYTCGPEKSLWACLHR